MKKTLVTTSWDDGHKLDLKLAELLKKYDLAGTFYVAPRDAEFDVEDRLSDAEIKLLDKDFEIGAHTMSHANLAKVAPAVAEREITESKHYLEKLLSKSVTSFCYPYGGFNLTARALVKRAGFTYARAVYKQSYVGDVFTAPVTVHAYRRKSDAFSILRFAGYSPVKFFKYLMNWELLGIAKFDEVHAQSGVFHLWGHSLEIERHYDWARLEKLLAHIAQRKDVQYIENRELGKSPKPKLLVAASYFHPVVGGLERYAWEMARAAKHAGYEVVVICSGTGKHLVRSIENGMTVYRLPYQLKLANTPVHAGWYGMIKRIIADEKPEVVNAHMPVPYLADLVIWASKDIPKIVTYHSGTMKSRGLLADRIIEIYETFVLPITLRKATRIVSTSDSTKSVFLKKYLDKIDVIHPGVDTDLFIRRKTAPKDNKVLFIGNFSYSWKGLNYLKAAIGLLPDVALSVVGKGPHAQSIRTTYCGILHGKELVDEIHSSQVVVLPSISNSESFGMVLIEAMACGVPVIGSNVGGIPQVIHDGTDGLLVAPKDPKALASALQKLLDDPAYAKRLANNGYAKVSEHYTWKKKAKLYVDMLDGMADERTAAVIGSNR